MFRSRQAQLDAAHAALRALDSTALERAELEANGVAQHTIDALYPESGFAALVPGLTQHLSRLSVADLTDAHDECQREINTLMKVVPNPLWNIINANLAFGQMADQVPRDQLAVRVFALLEDPARFPLDDTRDWVAESIVTAIWWAWWLMERPSLQTVNMKEPASDLTLAVATTLKFKPRRRALGGSAACSPKRPS